MSDDTFDAPSYELLRGAGWTVGAVAGRYCVAWRGAEEVVLVWHAGRWSQVAGRAAA
ncbi:MAG TPA: hypothetical protein VFG68_23375 [Fimbriiglobus sp.]|nr:hypothetical protein [Fimbriiglobus sp.]